MTGRWQSAENRILELLADEATFGSDAGERQELEALLTLYPDLDRDCMQRTAALVHLATCPREHAPLPGELEQKVRADALRFRLQSPEEGYGHFPG